VTFQRASESLRYRETSPLVSLDRLLGDDVPGEAFFDFAASVFAHLARMLKVGKDVPDTPGNGIGVGVDGEPRAIMRYELARAADHRRDHGFVGRPGLQDHDAKGLVAAGHAHSVAGFDEAAQWFAAHFAQPARVVFQTTRPGGILQVPAHLAIAGEDEHGRGHMIENMRDGVDQNVHALLIDDASGEEDHGRHWVEADRRLDLAGIAWKVEAFGLDAVVDHAAFVRGRAIVPRDLVLHRPADADDAFGNEDALPFAMPHGLALPRMDPVAAASVFCGMHRQQPSCAALILNEREYPRGKPIVRVDDVKLPGQGACNQKVVLERTAHVPCLVHEVGIMVERAAVQEDTILQFVLFLARGLARKEVDFVTEFRHCAGQFRNVDASTAHVYRIERLPGK
jgi:hypothetical protein